MTELSKLVPPESDPIADDVRRLAFREKIEAKFTPFDARDRAALRRVCIAALEANNFAIRLATAERELSKARSELAEVRKVPEEAKDYIGLVDMRDDDGVRIQVHIDAALSAADKSATSEAVEREEKE